MNDNHFALFLEDLETAFPELPKRYHVKWEEVTTLGVGGEIPVIAEPTDDISLAALLRFCGRHKVRVFVLGNGSNTVGSDSEFNALVIRLRQNDFIRVRMGRQHVTAGAGVRLSDFVNSCARWGLGGISPLIGIPGTVGGAIRMNAGANSVSISDFITEVCGFDLNGNHWSASKDTIEWGYRTNSIPQDVIITAAILKLAAVDKSEELEKIKAVLQARREKEPCGRSAGCAFKNISAQDSAGKMIDECGNKGYAVGGIEVSKVHANYLLNHNHASEQDVLQLIKKLRHDAFQRYGFYLEPEYRFARQESLNVLEQELPPLKVTVLKGGNSSEREISMLSGGAVANALRQAGFRVTECDIKENRLLPEMRDADVVFPVLHGGFGESGEIQKLMEDADIKFVGSGSEASAVCIDKVKSKQLMRKYQIPTPDWGIINQDSTAFPANLAFPVMVKAPREGSTVGVFFVGAAEEWDKTVREALTYDKTLLVEQYVKGPELTVAIVNGKALTPIEIRSPGQLYDYDAKYLHHQGETKYLCPPETISAELQQKAQKIAIDFYHACGARDLLRVDMILSGKNELLVLEANNIPGFTSSSLVPKAAAQAGMSFCRLCAALVTQAAKRK